MLAIRRTGSGAGTGPGRIGCGAGAAAQAPIWKTITIGEYKGANAVRAAIDAAPCPIAIGDRADEILGRPAFPFSRMKVDIDCSLSPWPSSDLVRMVRRCATSTRVPTPSGSSSAPQKSDRSCASTISTSPSVSFCTSPCARLRLTAESWLIHARQRGYLAPPHWRRCQPDFVLTGAVRFVFMRARTDSVASGVVPNARNELVKR